MNSAQQFFIGQPTATVLAHVALRLVLAAFLGGMIGLERELHHKPAGFRTQMLICIGAALFTVLSTLLAGAWGGDHTRIAAQIIPGIGFIGAGSILRMRGSVTGLTTAATLFVVASIGMAAGGGMYLIASFATVLVLLALLLLGWLEGRLRLKATTEAYEVMGVNTEQVVAAVNRALKRENCSMRNVELERLDTHTRMQFAVESSHRTHEALLGQLQLAPELSGVQSLGPPERE